MKRRNAAGFAIFILLYSAIHYYIGWNVIHYAEAVLGTANRLLVWVLLGVLAYSYLIGRLVLRQVPVLTTSLKLAGSYWFAVLQYSVILLPAADLAVGVMHLSGTPIGTSVRWAGTAAVAALLWLLLYGSFNAWSPVVRTYHVSVPKHAGRFRELTIAAASDLHLGTIIGNRHLDRLLAVVRGLKPDLILLPGDIIDDEIGPFLRLRMADRLAELKAPLGTYAVLGNHDYYGGDMHELAVQLDKIGIRLLRDEKVLVEDSFYVAGRKDKTAESMEPAGRKPIAGLLADSDKEKPVILLDHQPNQIRQAAEAGADILLCGHTHRGQMAPNHLITRRIFDLDWGYLKQGSLHAVVSSGFGTWGPPIRIGSRAEVIKLKVTFTGPPEIR